MDAFYDYWTTHTRRGERIAGMLLSVNGETGAVRSHTWHGEFIGMTQGGADEHDGTSSG